MHLCCFSSSLRLASFTTSCLYFALSASTFNSLSLSLSASTIHSLSPSPYLSSPSLSLFFPLSLSSDRQWFDWQLSLVSLECCMRRQIVSLSQQPYPEMERSVLIWGAKGVERDWKIFQGLRQASQTYLSTLIPACFPSLLSQIPKIRPTPLGPEKWLNLHLMHNTDLSGPFQHFSITHRRLGTNISSTSSYIVFVWRSLLLLYRLFPPSKITFTFPWDGKAKNGVTWHDGKGPKATSSHAMQCQLATWWSYNKRLNMQTFKGHNLHPMWLRVMKFGT